jgi:hypothetical protein
MAAYPSVGLMFDIKPVSEITNDISEAGTVRTANLNNATVYRIGLTHPLISSTDVGTLRTFFDTYKYTSNTITLAGVAYDVRFEYDYQVSSDSAVWFTARTSLIGTKT